MNEWLIIVNPNAGRKKGRKDWEGISALLTKNGFLFQALFTGHKLHAIDLTLQKIREGYRKFLVVGGDGTLNEVVNGMFSQQAVPAHEFTLGMIPVGTGNDWCRTFGVSFRHEEAIVQMATGKTFLQDVGCIQYQEDGTEKTRYFVNIAGMGYDALVAEKTNLQKEKGEGGPLSYFYNIFAGLLEYKFKFADIIIDGKKYRESIFSMNVGICKFNGGGMKQLPDAIPDDGIFDVLIIRKTSKFAVIRHVKKLYDGTLKKLPMVSMLTGKSVEITSDTPIMIEADGESLGHSPFRFSILPKALRVITGNYPEGLPISRQP